MTLAAMTLETPLKLWDAKDVARFFGASRSWVYQQVEAGKLPHLRVCGTLLRFDPEEIKAFAKKRGR